MIKDREERKKWECRVDLEHMPCAAFIWIFHERDAYLLDANQQYRDQFLQDGGGEKIPVFQGLLEAEKQVLKNRLARLTVDRRAISYNRRAVRNDGSSVWVRMDASYLDELEGDPVYFSILSDITGNILLQNQIDELNGTVNKLRDEQRDMFELIPFGLARVQCGEDGMLTVQSANHAFLCTIGYGEESFLKNCGNVLNLLDYGIPADSLEELVRAGEMPCRWKLRRRDGSAAWVNLNLCGKGKNQYFLSLEDISGLAEEEKELERREYYQSLLDRTKAGGILVRRADGNPDPLYMSGGISDVMGYTKEELTEMLCRDYMALLPPDEAKRQRKALASMPNRIGEYSSEYQVLKKDGTAIWILDNTRLETCPDGTRVYFSVLSDATESRKNEDLLRTREEEYRLAAAQSNKLVYRFHVAGRTIELPEDMARLYGIPSRIENIPESAIEMGYIAPESEADCRAFYGAMMRGEPYGLATVLSRKDKESAYRWILTKYTMVFAADGSPVSAVGTLEDISEQKEKDRLLDHLGREEELLRAVAVHSGRTVFKYDIKTRTVSREKDLTGLSGEMHEPDWGGVEPHLDQVAKESQEEYIAFFRAIDRGEKSGSALIRRKERTGKFVWLQANFTTIADEFGRPDYAVISFADITDNYEKEVAYRQYQQEFSRQEPKSYAYFIFNLTQDRCDQEKGRLLEHICGQGGCTLDGLVQDIAGQLPDGQPEAKFRRFNNRSRLLQLYSDGEREDGMELRTCINGSERWIMEKIQLFADPYSGDIRCMFSYTDIDEKKRKIESLLMRAEHDMQTGLFNRSAFCERVDALGNESELHFALILLDLDRFQAINDAYGSLRGDQVLIELSQTINSTLRQSDLLGRLEGDKFVICLRNIPDEGLALRRAHEICEKIRDSFSALGITASAGVAVSGKECRSFQKLYAAADQGLLKAKKRGGNCCIYMEQSEMLNQEKETVRPMGHIFIRTFGYFDVFVNMVPLTFPSPKAKELLAILVDRRGGILTSGEAINLLWEEEPRNQTTLARYRKVAARLKRILEDAGIGDLVLSKKDGRCVDVTKFSCDYYQYMKDPDSEKTLFRGSYMSNYSWGEMTLAELIEMQDNL